MQRMKRKALGTTLLLIVTITSSAQQPIVYPAKGQSGDQQRRDTSECQNWSKQTTGVDPVVLAQQMASSAPPPSGPNGALAKGALGGAAVGAIAGSFSGRAGQGAGAGAVVGMAGAGVRQHERQTAQAQQQQAAQARAADMLATFNRAYAACMSGRGYSIA